MTTVHYKSITLLIGPKAESPENMSDQSLGFYVHQAPSTDINGVQSRLVPDTRPSKATTNGFSYSNIA